MINAMQMLVFKLTEQTAWETFLTANKITSYAIALGSGAVLQLEPIAYDRVSAGNRKSVQSI